MSDKYWDLKLKFIQRYGGVCDCCGESNIQFLTLDHVQDDGAKERESIGWATGVDPGKQVPYVKVKPSQAFFKDAVENYDPKRYRVLCYNCNMGRAYNDGVCPHEDEPMEMKLIRLQCRDLLSSSSPR